MKIILPPELPHFEPYYRYERAFSPPECEAMIHAAQASGFSPGSIGIGIGQTPIVDPNYRMADSARLLDENLPWAFDRVRERVEWANQEYRFDLHGLFEDLGVMRYDAPAGDKPGGHYRWHQDFGGGIYSRRKVSVVALLTEPDEFEGGDLVLFTDGEKKANLQYRGDLVLFPSWVPHCVTPVTRGRRHSLVAWVSGPRFR